MKQISTMVIAAIFLLAGMGPAMAGVEYVGGRVVSGGAAYDGPGVSWEDAVGVGATGAGLAILTVLSEAGAQAIAPASFIGWGAWRTAHYRPQAVKDQIHASLEAQRMNARPGTVGDVLGQ